MKRSKLAKAQFRTVAEEIDYDKWLVSVQVRFSVRGKWHPPTLYFNGTPRAQGGKRPPTHMEGATTLEQARWFGEDLVHDWNEYRDLVAGRDLQKVVLG